MKKARLKEEPTQGTPDVNLDSAKHFELLKIEMDLLQGIFNKYDDLIFRNRGWLIALVTALLAGSIQLHKGSLALLATCVCGLFFLLEAVWRYSYVYKYKNRYRVLRDKLNTGQDYQKISVYDLTGLYGTLLPKRWHRLRDGTFKVEMFVFYTPIAALAATVRFLV